MSVEESAFQFLEYYLASHTLQKNIALLKIDLKKKLPKTEDQTYIDAYLIRAVLTEITKRKRPTAHVPPNLEPIAKRYFEFLNLSPEDCLLICSQRLFPIPLEILSLSLSQSKETLLFKIKQIERHLLEDRIIDTDLAIPPLPELLRTTTRAKNTTLLERFRDLPLPIRFSLETLSILSVLLGLLWVIPEARNRYETSIQKRINEYLIESSLTDSPPPAGTTKEGKPIVDQTFDTAAEDNALKSSSDTPVTRKPPKVIDGETWRFSFTGSATNEIEESVNYAIKNLVSPAPKSLTVPGGIQFDFILESKNLITLKESLERATGDIQQRTASEKINPLSVVNLSWYKKRNMGTRKIPSAHVQVIIWISTL